MFTIKTGQSSTDGSLTVFLCCVHAGGASSRDFQSFLVFLFRHFHIDLINLFNTRKDTFSKDEILQELVISLT